MTAHSLPAAIGRYRVDALLGEGAMGVVYKGHDPSIDRPVALKLVRADLLRGQEGADYRARFRQEAIAAGRCLHPNIVAVYDFAEHEGNPFIAMEYVEGTSLQDRLAQGERFAPAAALGTLAQVLDGLGAAHALGIVHRDVKPANVILLANGRVKLADFGVSRLDTSTLTQHGSVIGTPSYMSPEQCRGDPVDGRSDLFSAGAVLYELLTGAKPFPGESFTQVVYKVLTQDPAPLAGLVPGIAPAIEQAVRRALSKAPQDRYATAAEMADALRRAAAGTPPPDDHTVLLRPACRAPAPVDAEAAGTIERRLTRYIGPIAKVVLERSLRETTDLGTLCESLASNIVSGADRQRFLEEMRGDPQLATAAPPGPAAPLPAAAGGQRLSEADAAEIERAFAVHIGPIAGLILKREAQGAGSPRILCERLARHIEREDERARFRAAVRRWL